jgi:AcrR family transcriptional regulator
MEATNASDAPLRADAARNRQAIVEAARTVYRERGLDAPLDEIARLAGVGNATLYRHFGGRCALAAAVFEETLARVIAAADEALANVSAWDGFAGYIRFLCGMQATDRGLADVLTTHLPGAPELDKLRGQAYRSSVRVADRAKASGDLRPDFVAEDVVLLLMANAGLVHRSATTAPTAWRRYIDLVLDGLRAPNASPAAAPPSRAAIRRAMSERGRDLGYA